MSCKTCKTVAALIGIIFLAANDGIPSHLLISPSATLRLRLHADTGELQYSLPSTPGRTVRRHWLQEK